MIIPIPQRRAYFRCPACQYDAIVFVGDQIRASCPHCGETFDLIEERLTEPPYMLKLSLCRVIKREPNLMWLGFIIVILLFAALMLTLWMLGLVHLKPVTLSAVPGIPLSNFTGSA